MTNQCEHGQLGRSCLLCEMRDENLTLKREGQEALQEWAETEARLESKIEALRAKLADCQAWALRHKATVKGMEHNSGCAAVEFDGFATVVIPSRCNCPRGEALLEIEELLK